MNTTEQLEVMTQTKVEKLILRLAIPTIISMLITSFYNMVDTYFVGKIGTSATGAVGIVLSFMAILQAIGFFFGHGSGNFVSRRLGEQKMEEAERMTAVGFFSAMAGGCVIAVIGLLFATPLVRMLGATETILPHAVGYLQIIAIGAPFMSASLVLNNQLRFQGNAFFGMIGIVSGGILNILLDPLFIFGFDMGVSGAALATVLSQAVSFCLLFYFHHKKGIPIRLKNARLSFYYLRELARGGLPSLARQGCASIATICLNHMAGLYGQDAAIAAMSVVTRIMMFAYSAMIGYGQGFQPVCGFNYGAGRYDRVREAFWFCIKSSFFVLLAMGVLGGVFAPQLIGFFRDDPAVIEIGAVALRLQCITFPLTGFIVLANMMAQTIGMAFRATVLALSRQVLFFVPCLFLLSSLFGLTGVEVSQAAADLLSFGTSVLISVNILRQLKKGA